MAYPRVSVVLPTFNRPISVVQAARSVLDQDFRDLELILIDDGSTDPALPAAIENLARDPRVRILRHERNLGAGAARNTGTQAATGEFVAFQDSDDEWLPGKLSTQVAAMGAPAKVALCYTDQTKVEPDGRRSPFPAPQVTPEVVIDAVTHEWAVQGIGIQTCVFRADVLREAGPGPFDASLRRFIDLELLLRVCRAHAAIHLPHSTVLHHEGTGGISSNPKAQADARLVLLDRYGRGPQADRAFHAYQQERIAVNLALAGERGRALRHALAAARLEPRRLPWAARMLGAALRPRRD